MRKGIAAIFTPAAILLAVHVAFSAGCDTGTAPPPAPERASEARGTQPSGARYRMDPARNRMWVLTHEGVFLYDTGTSKLIAEVALPGWQEVDTQYTCRADLALGPGGEAVVTSNVVPTLWKVDADTLAVSVHELVLDADSNKDVGFSGLTYSVEHGVFFAVSDAHGSLWRIDPLFRRGQRVQLSEPVRKACGITVRPRGDEHRTPRLAALCVHTDEGGRTVNLAPDQRSAYVSAAPCAARLTHVAREAD